MKKWTNLEIAEDLVECINQFYSVEINEMKILPRELSNYSGLISVALEEAISLKESLEKENKTAKTHNLKILSKYFTEILNGSKTFELRKNDRDYKVGDALMLREFNGEEYTGNSVHVNITYILEGGQYGLDKEYVILGIKY